VLSNEDWKKTMGIGRKRLYPSYARIYFDFVGWVEPCDTHRFMSRGEQKESIGSWKRLRSVTFLPLGWKKAMGIGKKRLHPSYAPRDSLLIISA
jgi:hypothetical protein